MLESKWDIFAFATVSQTEIESDIDSICDCVEHGGSPFLLLGDDGLRMIIMGWEEYWSLFGLLHPPGEREKIEEECKKQ